MNGDENPNHKEDFERLLHLACQPIGVSPVTNRPTVIVREKQPKMYKDYLKEANL